MAYSSRLTGLLLVSKNWAYADKDGKVDWGPKSDKLWFQSMIRGKCIFCGHKTFLTLPESVRKLPSSIHVGTYPQDCDYHIGGPTTIYTIPPKRLIIHQANIEIDGPKFHVPIYYKLVNKLNLVDYTEYIYENTCK